MKRKRIRIEQIDASRSAALWLFTGTEALRSWAESGANPLELAMSEETFSVTVGPADAVYAERIGYEVAWNADNSYRYLNCVALVKSTVVPGKGIIMKAYVGWVDDHLLRFEEYHDGDFVVRFVSDDEELPKVDDDIDTAGSLAEAFAAALKNVDRAAPSGRDGSSG